MSDTTPDLGNPTSPSSSAGTLGRSGLPEPPAGPGASDPPLKREAIVMAQDRGRLGLLVALCSLAGVAVGFGLSSMASGLYVHQYSAQVAMARVQATVTIPAETPPWLGVRIMTAPSSGAAVEWVEENSPAQQAGIHPGDVIVGLARSGCPKRVRAVRTASELVRLVRNAQIGEHVLVVLERDGQSKSVRAELDYMPRAIYEQETQRWR